MVTLLALIVGENNAINHKDYKEYTLMMSVDEQGPLVGGPHMRGPHMKRVQGGPPHLLLLLHILEASL